MTDKTKETVVIHLDSLGAQSTCHPKDRIQRTLRELIGAFDEDFQRAHFFTPEVPQQKDVVSCGLFVLTFLHFFLHASPSHITMEGGEVKAHNVTEGHTNFLKLDWFSLANALKMRAYMRWVRGMGGMTCGSGGRV